MGPACLQAHRRTGASGIDRHQLSAPARALYENGGFVGYAVNQIALYCAPVIPQAVSADDDWNKAADTYFLDWAPRADFVGRPEMDLWALRTAVCQALDFDGDIGLAITAKSGFPQIQLIEAHQLPVPSSRRPAPTVTPE
jgi:hypothetical protein